MIRIEYAYSTVGDSYRALLDSIPKGKYFDNRATIIPVEDESEFRVTTTLVNELHYVSVICENGHNRSFTFIPSSEVYVLKLSLPKGLNTITVLYDDDEFAVESFSCTYFGSLMYAYAKELNQSVIRTDRLVRDIYKQESTRITAPVQQYSKQLSDKKAQRIFGLQLITRALINSPGTFESLEDICKAVFISTPKIEDIDYKNVFDLSYYSFAGQEYELGKIVYLWVRNPALVRRLYGIILANNFGISVTADDYSLTTEGGTSQYEDSENPLIVDENGCTEYDEEQFDGYLEINYVIDIDLSRDDRNLPIPFTDEYQWYDPNDEGINEQVKGKQYIPYRYDKSKVTSLFRVSTESYVNNSNCTLEIEQSN